MSRARARTQADVASFVAAQPSLVGIEMVDEDTVGAQIGRDCKAVGRIGDDAVGMRSALTLGYRPPPRVLDDGCRRPEGPVGLYREERDGAAVVVGDEHDAAARVHAHVAGRAPFRWCLAELAECAVA